MTNGSAAPTPAGASTYDWLTTANLIAIAVFAVIVVIAILWGARLKAQRKAAEQALREDATTAAPDRQTNDATLPATAAIAPVATLTPADPAPADPAPQAAHDQGADQATQTPPPATAPSPPPLADTPVVAAAPFDAAPATIAADLANQPADSATTAGDGDDLTRLKGVGPKLASRLAELDITRFDQIAALTPTDAEALDAQLGTFRGRLTRDRWIEQAGYLARDDRDGFEAAFGKL